MASEPAAVGKSMANVFISYRRDDSPYVTGRIRERLEARFGRESVFTDVDSIPLGVDFAEVIADRVGRCQALVAVIGPQWLDIGDASGSRRLEDPHDFVRVEIEAALSRGILVIPVLVQGASMPEASRLPETLRSLSTRNGLSVRTDPDFDRDAARLLSALGGSDDGPAGRRFGVWARASVALLGVASLAALMWIVADRGDVGARVKTPPVATVPDWRTATTEMRVVDGVEYFEVDFSQGMTAAAVCRLVGKVPGEFTTRHEVCQAFQPDAALKFALSGDRAVVYCSGQPSGLCADYKNACVVCLECKVGVGVEEWGGRLYGRMYTTCRPSA